MARDLWSLMEAAADYSFNRSHAACYALIAYRTAWLRANYPAEYMAALISTVMSTKDKVPFFVNRCAEMGIEVLPPDVNSSDHGFVVSGKSIRFGLDAVKNVGHQAVQAILDARRKDGEFTSIWDFCERVDTRAVNKRAVECLVKCGALDSTGASRRGMLEVLPSATSFGQKAQEDSRMGQGSIFDLGGGAADAGEGPSHHHPPIITEEFDQRELLRLEKETLGTYLSSHPLADVKDALKARVDCSLSSLGEKQDGSWVTVGGIVTEFKRHTSKNGSLMSFATLDDVEGQVELLVMGKAYEASREFLAVGTIVIVRGRLDHKGRGETKLVAQEVELFEPTEDEVTKGRARQAGPFRLTINAAEFGVSLIEDLKSILRHFPGEDEVLLVMQTREGSRELRFGKDYRVRRSAALEAEIASLLGSGSQAAA